MSLASEVWDGSELTTMEAALAVIGLFLLFRLVRVTYNLTLHPLAKFPGPLSTAISRVPLVVSHLKGKQYQFVEDLHNRYGPIVRVAPDEITLTDPGAWNDVYARRPGLHKDPLSLQPPLNNAHSLFTAEDATHLRLRRLIGKGFSEHALRQQSPIIHSHVEILMAQLEKATQEPDGKCDLAQWYGYTTVDILSDLTLGESLSTLKNQSQHPWMKSFFMGMRFSSLRTSLSRHWPMDWLAGAIVLKALSKQRLANWQFMTDRVTNRLRAGNKRPDFISPMIEVINDSDKGITRNELNTNTLALMMAGAELPAVALSTVTYYLLSNPDTFKTLNDEIRSAFSSEDMITVTSTEHLPYLRASIDESLRIHHPTPSPMPRVIPEAGIQLGPNWLPGGTVAGIALGAILRSAANFAAPLEFHPERFLPSADSRFTNDNKDAFKPFSTGLRSCIGSRLALAEMRVILARIAYVFDMELVDNTPKDWPNRRAWIVCENKALMVHLTKRSLTQVATC